MQFLSILTDFVNVVLVGHCPTVVSPVIIASRLLALKDKKTGDICLISIGFMLRHMTSKYASAFSTDCPTSVGR